jgi:hypothetical protein
MSKLNVEAQYLSYDPFMSEKQAGHAKSEDVDSAEAPDSSEMPYAVEEFAEKYGLSHKAADVVLMANGPSRQKSDAGARAFLAAVAAFRRR